VTWTEHLIDPAMTIRSTCLIDFPLALVSKRGAPVSRNDTSSLDASSRGGPGGAAGSAALRLLDHGRQAYTPARKVETPQAVAGVTNSVFRIFSIVLSQDPHGSPRGSRGREARTEQAPSHSQGHREGACSHSSGQLDDWVPAGPGRSANNGLDRAVRA
jgi:hypothetical protein